MCMNLGLGRLTRPDRVMMGSVGRDEESLGRGMEGLVSVGTVGMVESVTGFDVGIYGGAEGIGTGGGIVGRVTVGGVGLRMITGGIRFELTTVDWSISPS